MPRRDHCGERGQRAPGVCSSGPGEGGARSEEHHHQHQDGEEEGQGVGGRRHLLSDPRSEGRAMQVGDAPQVHEGRREEAEEDEDQGGKIVRVRPK